MIILLAASVLLNAIDFREADGRLVNAAWRDSTVQYHNHTLDHLWYGTSSWAVKFDFEEYFGPVSGLQFAAEGALIYIPGSQSSDPLTLKICKNNVTQPLTLPDSLLYNTAIQPGNMIFDDWNIIEFDQVITDSLLWMVVDYPTNSTDQFIAASTGSGLHSYFWNSEYEFYFPMSSLNYQSEFLFGFYGYFVTNGSDLDVYEFDFTGNLTTSARIYPRLVVRNTSNQTAQDPYLLFTLSHPAGVIFLQEEVGGIVHDTLFVDDIPANTTIIYDFTDSLYFSLQDSASQYRATAEVGSPDDVLLQNNSKSLNFNTFNNSFRTKVVENSLVLGSSLSNDVLTEQQALIDPQYTEIINYFPNSSDLPFFCQDSADRFNYYDLLGNPNTMINGSRKIIGYLPNIYTSKFTQFYADTFFDSTYISSFDVSGKYSNSGFAEVAFNISNDGTKVFPSFLNNSSVYVMIVEDVIDHTALPGSFNIPVLRKIPAQFTAPPLSAGSSYADSVSFDYQLDFSTIGGDISNCRALVILQHDVTKQIYGLESLPFSDFQLVSVQQNNLSGDQAQLNIFPNPFYLQGDMKIDFALKRNARKAELKIYNVKGQLVRKIINDSSQKSYSFMWDGRDENNQQAASGVYLLRLSAQSGDDIIDLHRKCLLLKK